MFWIVVALLLAACILVMAAALRGGAGPGVRPDVDVYRDQLRELERDAARGTLDPEEAEAARTEVARRLLAADRVRVTRLAEELKQVLAARPNDLRGWRLAVQTQAGLGDLEAAWQSQDRVIAILGEEAGAEEFALLAELMILAAGGYVSPQAETALSEAVRRDRANGTARYYAGLMYAQGGRPDRAFGIWRGLIAESAPGDPWLDPIYAQIEEISVLAGDPTPLDELPQPRGPSVDDIEAAGDMTPQDRIEMIGDMVQGLSERLANEGGTAEEWARLITSYGVLGRTDAAATVYAEAKTVFAADRGALDTLARAADRAGINP
mgnify:CR=1 FL=1